MLFVSVLLSMSASLGVGIWANEPQRQNPICSCVRRVKVQFISPSVTDSGINGLGAGLLPYADFVVNSQLAIPIIFLSLKFHVSFNRYIEGKIEALLKSTGNSGQRPVLLCQVDIDDESQVEAAMAPITHLTSIHGLRLLVCWSATQGATILEALHVFGPDRAAEIARGAIFSSSKEANDIIAKDAICTVQGGVGPKDAATLLSHFGSMQQLVSASKDQLLQVPLIGRKKANHLFEIFNVSLN